MRPLRTAWAYLRIFGLAGAWHLLYCLLSRRPRLARVASRWSTHPLYLRLNTSDVNVFRQVFLQREYAITEQLRAPPATIIDAGANIGLASVWLAERHPRARLWAVEPDAGNFELLERNTRGYGRIACVRGALWHRDERLALDTSGAEWAYQVRAGAPTASPVEGWRVSTFMDRHGLARASLLKMDIEGAEHEVLGDAAAWAGRVDAVVAELHEAMRPGVGARFAQATAGFALRAAAGELTLAARAG